MTQVGSSKALEVIISPAKPSRLYPYIPPRGARHRSSIINLIDHPFYLSLCHPSCYQDALNHNVACVPVIWLLKTFLHCFMMLTASITILLLFYVMVHACVHSFTSYSFEDTSHLLSSQKIVRAAAADHGSSDEETCSTDVDNELRFSGVGR